MGEFKLVDLVAVEVVDTISKTEDDEMRRVSEWWICDDSRIVEVLQDGEIAIQEFEEYPWPVKVAVWTACLIVSYGAGWGVWKLASWIHAYVGRWA